MLAEQKRYLRLIVLSGEYSFDIQFGESWGWLRFVFRNDTVNEFPEVYVYTGRIGLLVAWKLRFVDGEAFKIFLDNELVTG